METIPEKVEIQNYNPQPLAVDKKRMPSPEKIEKKIHVDVDHNNVIKLLIRVSLLYQALSEVMHILELILQQREMFNNVESILNQAVKEFLNEKKDEKPLTIAGDKSPQHSEKMIIKG